MIESAVPQAPKTADNPTAWTGYMARMQTVYLRKNPKASPTDARRAVYPQVLNALLLVAPSANAVRFLGPEPAAP